MFLENVLDVLVEAEQYIRDLPFEATADIWEAMRNYGKIHGDMDLEDYAEELMVELDPFEGTNKIIDEAKEMAAKKGSVYVPDTRCVCMTLTRRLKNRHYSTTVRVMVNVLVAITGRAHRFLSGVFTCIALQSLNSARCWELK
ncbi:hypothetical protein F2Q70_00010528 [Brassica cretica]|uniref:Uncharacterized protein n=1 Tax=Brassica cretica TaxID=69181 RepID=A0A8S9M160_BRACR|nr:hypothetical protein F2Q70_00010528 [Brassica cretica]KAF3551497.1 hypothetical protein DY000_02005261 [Brassica cretica]